jgi:hypothetical protein
VVFGGAPWFSAGHFQLEMLRLISSSEDDPEKVTP